jgi:hypothetical protein
MRPDEVDALGLRLAAQLRGAGFDDADFDGDREDPGVFVRGGRMRMRPLVDVWDTLDPWEREVAEARWIHAIQDEPELPTDPDDVIAMIRPRLRSLGFFTSQRLAARVEGRELAPLAWALTDHLAVDVVLDLGDRLVPCSVTGLASWGLSPEEALDRGVTALAAQPRWDALSPGLWRTGPFDDHAASRMMVWRHARPVPTRGAPVLLPAQEDLLLVAGADDADALMIMAAVAGSLRGPLLAGLPVQFIDAVGWVPWRPEAAHPAARAFRALEVRAAVEAVASQRDLLSRLSPVEPAWLFADADGQHTEAVLSDAPCWVPEADRVRLPSGEVVAWASFLERCSAEPVAGVWPRRWAYSEEAPRD